MTELLQAFFGIPSLAIRWEISKDTIVRAVKRGELKTVYLCGRRMVPATEVERIERDGLGNGRRKPAKKGKVK